MIDIQAFFNVKDLFVSDDRINKCKSSFNIEKGNEIMDIFLTFPTAVSNMNNQFQMHNISNH